MCFLEPSTHICVAKESLLARKPTLKALLILTDASLGFIGTYIKKNQFLETLSVSVPAKGRGRECSSWGTLRLPWRFQAEGESTSVILGCSTKAFQPRTCGGGNSTAFQGSVSHQSGNLLQRAAAYPSLPPPPSPAPTEIAACV